MTILNIYRKFEFHFLFYIVGFLAVLTGFFKEFIIFTIIILIHEYGHLVAALYYNWKVEKVIIYPFGGLTIFKETLNKPIKEELNVVLLGPVYQILFYILCNLIAPSSLLFNFHYAILIFNLLPIYPLDGSKILNLGLNKILPYKIGHLITIYISFISIIGLIIISFYLNNTIIMGFILLFIIFKIYEELKKHPYLFNKFLFERYLYNLNFKKTKTLKNQSVDKMYRDYKHIFKIKKKYHTEREILRKRFDFHK